MRAGRPAAVLRVLPAFEGAREVVPRAVPHRRRDVRLLDAAADLLEELLLERRRCGRARQPCTRSRPRGSRAPRVVAVPQPEPRVDAVSPCAVSSTGRAGAMGGARESGIRRSLPSRNFVVRETAREPRSTTGTLLGDVGCPSHRPVARFAVGDPDRGHRSRDPCRRVRRRTAWSPRSSRKRRPGQVLMFAWMNEGRCAGRSRPAAPGSGAGAARSTGARARPRATGSTSARRLLRLRHGRAALRRRAGGPGRLPHRGAELLLPGLRRRRRARSRVSLPTVKPSLDEFRALAREYTVVPVWREVLADLETPVSAFVKLVGDREGFLLESVEHGEHWGRFSFIGRDPALTLVVRGNQVETSARSRRTYPSTAVRWRPSKRCSPGTARRAWRTCRRFTAASSGISATTSCGGRAPSRRARRTRSAGPTRCSRSPVTSPRSTTTANGCT